jgi:hypothetical protein
LGDNKLYEKLNVEKDADGAIIKRAYKKLSLKLHPDRNPHPKAEAAFQALNKANEVIRSPHSPFSFFLFWNIIWQCNVCVVIPGRLLIASTTTHPLIWPAHAAQNSGLLWSGLSAAHTHWFRRC